MAKRDTVRVIPIGKQLLQYHGAGGPIDIYQNDPRDGKYGTVVSVATANTLLSAVPAVVSLVNAVDASGRPVPWPEGLELPHISNYTGISNLRQDEEELDGRQRAGHAFKHQLVHGDYRTLMKENADLKRDVAELKAAVGRLSGKGKGKAVEGDVSASFFDALNVGAEGAV